MVHSYGLLHYGAGRSTLGPLFSTLPNNEHGSLLPPFVVGMTPPLLHDARRRIAALGFVVVAACSGSGESAEIRPTGDQSVAANQLFTRLSAAATGIRFENRLEETREL